VASHATGPSTPAQRFEIIEGLRFVDLDDDCVVFDPGSWDAHILNGAAAAVLDLLQQCPQSMADVQAFLSEALDPRERDFAASHAERLIDELQSLGLLRPLPGQTDAAD
jgi:PqqD family protein of HPr-rel-A system